MERVKTFIDDLISGLRYRNREIKPILIVSKYETSAKTTYVIKMENQVKDLSIENLVREDSYSLIIGSDQGSLIISDKGGKLKDLYLAAEDYYKDLITINLENSDHSFTIRKDSLKDQEEEMQIVLDIIENIYRE